MTVLPNSARGSFPPPSVRCAAVHAATARASPDPAPGENGTCHNARAIRRETGARMARRRARTERRTVPDTPDEPGRPPRAESGGRFREIHRPTRREYRAHSSRTRVGGAEHGAARTVRAAAATPPPGRRPGGATDHRETRR